LWLCLLLLFLITWTTQIRYGRSWIHAILVMAGMWHCDPRPESQERQWSAVVTLWVSTQHHFKVSFKLLLRFLCNLIDTHM
jgi:hypothetical protein